MKFISASCPTCNCSLPETMRSTFQGDTGTCEHRGNDQQDARKDLHRSGTQISLFYIIDVKLKLFLCDFKGSELSYHTFWPTGKLSQGAAQTHKYLPLTFWSWLKCTLLLWMHVAQCGEDKSTSNPLNTFLDIWSCHCPEKQGHCHPGEWFKLLTLGIWAIISLEYCENKPII